MNFQHYPQQNTRYSEKATACPFPTTFKARPFQWQPFHKHFSLFFFLSLRSLFFFSFFFLSWALNSEPPRNPRSSHSLPLFTDSFSFPFSGTQLFLFVSRENAVSHFSESSQLASFPIRNSAFYSLLSFWVFK